LLPKVALSVTEPDPHIVAPLAVGGVGVVTVTAAVACELVDQQQYASVRK